MSLTYKFYSGEKIENKKITRDYRLPKSYTRLLEKNPLWTEGERLSIVDFSDLSEYSLVKQYIDGFNNIYLKHVYAKLKKYYNPETYVLQPKDQLRFSLKNSLWFMKISTDVSGLGNDIFLVDSKEEIKKILKKYNNKTFILQKAINNPLLLNGRKTDVRFYGMIVYNENKIELYVYKKYLLRLAVKQYEENSKDPLVQLTNSAMAIKYDKKENWYSQTVLIDKNENVELYGKMVKISKDVIETNKFETLNGVGFVMVGFDFVITEDLKKVYLIEVNRRPQLYEYDDELKNLIHKNIEDNMLPENVEIIQSLLLEDYKPKIKNWIKVY